VFAIILTLCSGFTGLAADPLLYILDTLALVRLRLLECPEVGRGLADHLLVVAGEGNYVLLDFGLNAVG